MQGFEVIYRKKDQVYYITDRNYNLIYFVKRKTLYPLFGQEYTIIFDPENITGQACVDGLLKEMGYSRHSKSDDAIHDVELQERADRLMNIVRITLKQK